jgi:hypothetical protein
MQKPENSTILNVCIIPNEQVSSNYVTLSQSLKSEDTIFVLGAGRFAHMTGFMARFANDRIDSAVEATEQALRSATRFSCEHTGYLMTEGRYLEASYRKSPELLALHEALIGHLAELRLNPDNPYEEGYFTPYSPEQQKNARETGYDLARNLYRPHVTLTRYKEGFVPKRFPALPEVSLSFMLDKICLYKADDNGAVYELIKEFHV